MNKDQYDIELETACEVMHEAYEVAAVKVGWETQTVSNVPWDNVPEANKATMRAAVAALMEHLTDEIEGERESHRFEMEERLSQLDGWTQAYLALKSERDEALVEVERLRSGIKSYEDSISWDVTCLNCSNLWSQIYQVDTTVEKIADELAAAAAITQLTREMRK